MSVLRGVGRFLFDFIVGDDWRIAAGVVAALLIGFGLIAAGVPVPVGVVATAVLVGAGFAVTMLREGRSHRGR